MLFVLVLLTGFLIAAFEAWIIMLLVGAIHSDVWSDVPALGFWSVFLILVLINLVVGFARAPSAVR